MAELPQMDVPFAPNDLGDVLDTLHEATAVANLAYTKVSIAAEQPLEEAGQTLKSFDKKLSNKVKSLLQPAINVDKKLGPRVGVAISNALDATAYAIQDMGVKPPTLAGLMSLVAGGLPPGAAAGAEGGPQQPPAAPAAPPSTIVTYWQVYYSCQNRDWRVIQQGQRPGAGYVLARAAPFAGKSQADTWAAGNCPAIINKKCGGGPIRGAYSQQSAFGGNSPLSPPPPATPASPLSPFNPPAATLPPPVGGRVASASGGSKRVRAFACCCDNPLKRAFVYIDDGPPYDQRALQALEQCPCAVELLPDANVSYDAQGWINFLTSDLGRQYLKQFGCPDLPLQEGQ